MYRLLNDKHPDALGMPFKTLWSEIYAFPENERELNQVWEEGRLLGKAVKMDRQTYFLRNGSRLEERVFNLSLIPIIDHVGETIGFYEPLVEVTTDHVNNRWLSVLSKIGEVTASEGNLAAFFGKIIDALRDNSMSTTLL